MPLGSIHTGHLWVPVKLPEAEGHFLQVCEGHLRVFQHGLLICLESQAWVRLSRRIWDHPSSPFTLIPNIQAERR